MSNVICISRDLTDQENQSPAHLNSSPNVRANTIHLSHQPQTSPISLNRHSLPDIRPLPLLTIHFLRRPHRQPYTTTPEQRRIRPIINAQIKVHIRPILIRARRPALCAQWVSVRGTQVVNLDNDAGCAGQCVAGAIS